MRYTFRKTRKWGEKKLALDVKCHVIAMSPHVWIFAAHLMYWMTNIIRVVHWKRGFPVHGRSNETIYSLHDSHGIVKSFPIIVHFRMSHCRFQQYIDRHFAHVIMHVKLLAHFFPHPFHQPPAIPIECTDETLQHKLMERWRNQFSMWSPFFAVTYK